MSLSLALLALLTGLVMLAVCGDRLVSCAMKLALRFGLSPILVGVVIIGLGTSLPEILLSFQAALSGQFGIAHGNIIGSNIANILLALGLAGLVAVLPVATPGSWRLGLLVLAATVLWMVVTALIGLNPLIGILFLLCLAGALFLVQTQDIQIEQHIDASPLWRLIALAVLSLVGLPLGAHLLIISGADIAARLGVSSEVIGLTIVALGTSLPEIAAAMVATLRKETQLVIGNVLGSNLFNILGAGGLVAMVGAHTVSPELQYGSHPTMFGSALILSLFILWKRPIGRVTALIFLTVYLVYIFTLYRG